MRVKENFEDYSSGRVLYGAPGATNFPVRLAGEIFEECKKYLVSKANPGPYTVYDPFCGAAYSLTVLGLMYATDIEKIYGSDTDDTILQFADKNLSLLSREGMDCRIKDLKHFIEEYKKDSHREALDSAEVLKKNLKLPAIKIETFEFNIISEAKLPKEVTNIDIVITDIPYGKLTHWEGLQPGQNPTQEFLSKIKDRLNKKSIIAIAANKKQEISYEGFTKVKQLKTPKRKVLFLTSSN